MKMSLEKELQEFISRFSYKPESKLSARITPRGVTLELTMKVFDAVKGDGTKDDLHFSSNITLEAWSRMDLRTRIAMVQNMIYDAERHEVDEFLRFNNIHVRLPHPPIDYDYRKDDERLLGKIGEMKSKSTPV